MDNSGCTRTHTRAHRYGFRWVWVWVPVTSHHLATSSPTTSNNTTTTLQHDNDMTTDEGGAQEGRMTMVGGGLSCPSPKTGSYFKLFNLYFTLLIHNKITPSVSHFEQWKPLRPPPL